jgi:hypothetical protein
MNENKEATEETMNEEMADELSNGKGDDEDE